jgi:hypothetical protein
MALLSLEIMIGAENIFVWWPEVGGFEDVWIRSFGHFTGSFSLT